ncbi:MAG: hypothetical protein WCW87_00900 [Candidatus Paceibacterota bacterium]
MNFNSSTKKILFLSGLLALISATLYFFVYYQIQSKYENVFSLKSEVSKVFQNENNSFFLKKAFVDIESERKNINSHILAHENVVDFIQMVETLGKDNNLDISIESVQTEDISNSDDVLPVENMKIRIKTEGGFENSYRFISLLENIPYKTDFKTVYLNVRGSDLSSEDSLLPGGNLKKKSSSVSQKWSGIIDMNVLKFKEAISKK